MVGEGLGSQLGGQELYVAEKCLYGDFRFVKGFRHLSHQTQQCWSEIGHLFCRGCQSLVAQPVPVLPASSWVVTRPVP